MHCLLDKNNSQTQTFFYSTVSGQEERLACIATITCNKLLCQTSSGYNVCGPILVSDPAHKWPQMPGFWVVTEGGFTCSFSFNDLLMLLH